MLGDPLVVGFQLCTRSAGAPVLGVQGLQLCVSADGAHVGHNSIFRGLGFMSECGSPHLPENHRGCWTSDMDGSNPQQELNNFWRADFAQSNLTWSKFTKGDDVPSNAYHINGRLLARSTGTIPSSYGAKGSLVPGWVVPSDGKLGRIDYEDHGPLSEDTFYLATCHPPTQLRYRCDNTTAQCVTVNSTACVDKKSSCGAAVSSGLLDCATDLCPSCPKHGLCDKTCGFCRPSGGGNSSNGTTFPTQQLCAASCIAPPPPPLSKNPCIRFGHAIPVPHNVDVEISQVGPPATTHTWTNFKFGDFSDWVNVFKPGTGTITVWENVGGVRGAMVYRLKDIPLTPGPLVVVIKVAASVTKNASAYWPPSLPDAIETIAASYVNTDAHSKVRLFNLSPDTARAGMTSSGSGGKEIASSVAYGLGSPWVTQPSQSLVFGFKDDTSGKTLTTLTLTPEAAPIGNTNVLLGLQGSTGAYTVQAVPLTDAPEGGTCHP